MYSRLIKELSKEYERKRDLKKREKDLRVKKLYRELPAIERIDDEIFKIGLDTSKNIIGNPETSQRLILEAKEKIEELKMEKAYIMTESNIPADYMEIKYDCSKCQDRGYIDGEQCVCLKQKLVSRAYEMSNIESILSKENFSTFDIKKFSNEKFEDESLSPRENMIEIRSISKAFIDNFKEDNDINLLFYGTTGLGKTFLSNCIAKELLDKNYIVIYQTAFTILNIIEKYRFKRGDESINEFQYNLLFESDLLIIDDLGTELSNSFTNAEIFNIINTRIIAGKKTIISTNLTPKEISDIYTDRVFSRILDKFIPLKFYGPDLRWQ